MPSPVNLGSTANPFYEIDPATGLPIQGTGGTGSAVGGNVASGAADSGNPVKIGAVYGYAGAITTLTVGYRTDLQTDVYGSLRVAPTASGIAPFATGALAGYTLSRTSNTATSANALPLATMGGYWDGTNIIPAPGNATGGFTVSKPFTAGGLTTSRIVTGTTGFIKASAGQVYKITAYNVNAAVRYLHIYNKATAPTLSTDTPLITIALMPTSAREIDLSNLGAAFSTGIAWAYTTDDVAIPTTAGTSTELHATVFYA